MSPIKSGINAARKIHSGAQFINVPRFTVPFHWKSYLKRLLDTPQNRKTFDRCEHADIQELLRRQANEQFKNDTKQLKKALAEAAAQANESALADAKGRRNTNGQRRASIGPLADEAAKLNIPRLCHSSALKSERSSENIGAQTYRSFADQAKRKNLEAVFTKDLMDRGCPKTLWVGVKPSRSA